MSKKKRTPFGWFSPDDEDWFEALFSHLFEEIEKEREELFREPEKMRELWRLAEKPSKDKHESGLYFKLFSDGIHPPRIEVSRLGPKGWEPVQKEIRGVPLIKETKQPVELPSELSKPPHKPAAKVKEPIIYEEAPYTYKIDINQVIIELKASGVEKEENIELQFYPESLEIKAIAPKTKKGYFTVLKIPAQIDQENTEVEIKKDKVVIRIPRKHAMPHEVE